MSGDPLGALLGGTRLLSAGSAGGPLAGLTCVVKDGIDIQGEHTGAGNPAFLEDSPVAATHAPSVARLVGAGVSVVGKAHMDELAFSLSGTNVHYGTPINIRAPGRVPGGSSSGSAAAVAGGLAHLGLGTDTGGSIRVPASYCGVYGYRPTHGRVPLDGVVPLAPSFDTVGLLAADGGALLAGGAALLATEERPRTVGTVVVAVDLVRHADASAGAAVVDAAGRLAKALGAGTINAEVAGDRLERWADAFRRRQLAEAWAEHGAWIRARRPVLGPGVAARFAAAERGPRPDELEPLARWRDEVRAAVLAHLGPDRLLALPAAASVAPRVHAGPETKEALRQRTMRLTCIAGLAGLPAVSLPWADVDGLPVGVCLLGRPGDDELLLAAAAMANGGAASGARPEPGTACDH